MYGAEWQRPYIPGASPTRAMADRWEAERKLRNGIPADAWAAGARTKAQFLRWTRARFEADIAQLRASGISEQDLAQLRARGERFLQETLSRIPEDTVTMRNAETGRMGLSPIATVAVTVGIGGLLLWVGSKLF